MPSESSLAMLQSRMATALLAADPTQQLLAEEQFAGAHPGATGLRVHRNTVLGALSNALRQSFVSVERLVGEAFFDRLAVEYARVAPPRAPQLDIYGSDFPEFIASYPGTESLPYLAELARFDWQLDELARMRASEAADEPSPQAVSLLLEEGGTRLRFLPSLRLHRARFAVDRLRDAILAKDTAALSAIGLAAAGHEYALWRSREGVKAQDLSGPAACFLRAALNGSDGPAALAAAVAAVDAVTTGAAADHSESAVVEILTREILAANFVRIEMNERLETN